LQTRWPPGSSGRGGTHRCTPHPTGPAPPRTYVPHTHTHTRTSSAQHATDTLPQPPTAPLTSRRGMAGVPWPPGGSSCRSGKARHTRPLSARPAPRTSPPCTADVPPQSTSCPARTSVVGVVVVVVARHDSARQPLEAPPHVPRATWQERLHSPPAKRVSAGRRLQCSDPWPLLGPARSQEGSRRRATLHTHAHPKPRHAMSNSSLGVVPQHRTRRVCGAERGPPAHSPQGAGSARTLPSAHWWPSAHGPVQSDEVKPALINGGGECGEWRMSSCAMGREGHAYHTPTWSRAEPPRWAGPGVDGPRLAEGAHGAEARARRRREPRRVACLRHPRHE
jgi:hypothetical protein